MKIRKENLILPLVLFALILLPTLLLITNIENITQENDTFILQINSEVDTDASKYLEGLKDPEEATVFAESVDVHQEGIYDMKISYKGTDYTVHIDVRDIKATTREKAYADILDHLDLSKTDTSSVNYPATIPENAVIGGEFITSEEAYEWADQYLSDPTSEWNKANAGSILRSLNNGHYYIWIEKY